MRQAWIARLPYYAAESFLPRRSPINKVKRCGPPPSDAVKVLIPLMLFVLCLRLLTDAVAHANAVGINLFLQSITVNSKHSSCLYLVAIVLL